MTLSTLESWMWSEACEMMERADRLHRQFFKPAAIHASRPLWEPPMDIYETARGIKIMVALPGVAKDDVQIIQEGRQLTVSGCRQLPVNAETGILRLEIPYGRFERCLEIPADNVEISSREFIDGCLILSLKKT